MTFTKQEKQTLKEMAQERIHLNKIHSNESYNKKFAGKKKNKICDFLGDGKCNSKYGKNMKCDGVHTPEQCPWKNGGSYAMAVHDQANRKR